VDIPIVVYNIAGRTAVNVEPATLQRLCKDCRNISGVKESSGSLEQMSMTKLLCPDIDMLSGDDALTLPLMAVGGTGVISVLSNIAPSEVVALVKAFESGNIKEAVKLHYKIYPLVKAMFIETNPIPVKTAASMLGMCALELRLPMCDMEEANKLKLEKAMKDFGLLK
jgi:4-hydroxy-tetrahydrodipicolinate synthase